MSIVSTLLIAIATTTILCIIPASVSAGKWDGDCPESCFDQSMLCPRSRGKCENDDERYDTLRKVCPATCKQCKLCIKNSALQSCARKVAMTETCIPYARYDTTDEELLSAQVNQHCDGHNDGQKYVNCMIAGRDLTQCCINEGAGECKELCAGLYDMPTATKCILRENLRNSIRRCIDGTSKWAIPE